MFATTWHQGALGTRMIGETEKRVRAAGPERRRVRSLTLRLGADGTESRQAL
jgi:hypothetical protein